MENEIKTKEGKKEESDEKKSWKRGKERENKRLLKNFRRI